MLGKILISGVLIAIQSAVVYGLFAISKSDSCMGFSTIPEMVGLGGVILTTMLSTRLVSSPRIMGIPLIPLAINAGAIYFGFYALNCVNSFNI